MNRLLKMALAAALVLGFASATASANSVKGQKLYSKFLKKPCGMTGAKFAAKHSQYEWEMIFEDGNLEAEIMKICPKVPEGYVKKRFQKHIFDFAYEYANDSGNVPSC